MRIIKEQEGTVTIYLAVVFMVMIVFIGVFVDMARIRLAQSQLRRITNSAARSVMANYNTLLKNQYGLFAVNNDGDFQGEFQNYIKINLEDSNDNNFKLLGCQYEGCELVLSEPIDNLTSLKFQVLEDMKYSAPIDISRDLIDKFKSIGSLTQLFGEQNQKRKIIKSANTKIRDIGEINNRIREKKNKLKQDKLLLKSADEQIRKREITKQIARDKEEIITEINFSKNKWLEVQEEIDQLANWNETPNNNAVNNAVGRLDSEIQNNLDNFWKVNLNVLITDMQDIKKNMDQAETALAGITIDDVISEDLFSKLELDPGNMIYNKFNNSKLSGYRDLQQELTVNRNVYMKRFGSDQLLRNSKVKEEQVSDVVDYLDMDETDQKLENQEQILNQISTILSVEKNLSDMRNELYLNEYLLTHCSFITSEPKGNSNYDKRHIESEYVLYGSNALEKAVSELYLTRFTLDTLGYLVFSKPPAPVELLSRSIYSLIMGALQASVDTYKLLADSNNTVSIVEMMPDNPMEKLDFTLTYKDHLRLFMLLHSDEQGKLKRLMEVIKQRNNIETSKAFTLLDGNAVVSIKLWFLPLTGLNNVQNGPFETEIRNGRCYINKNVEFGY